MFKHLTNNIFILERHNLHLEKGLSLMILNINPYSKWAY